MSITRNVIIALLIMILWLWTLVSFGNFMKHMTRCETRGGTYEKLNGSRICIAPGGIKTISVDK